MCGFTYLQGSWITSIVGSNTIFYAKYNNKYGTFKRDGSSDVAYAVSGGDSGFDTTDSTFSGPVDTSPPESGDYTDFGLE